MGQGDATLIIMPNGQTMLIDGGPYEAGEVIIQKLIEKGINHLDVIVSTHPDMHHIGVNSNCRANAGIAYIR